MSNLEPSLIAFNFSKLDEELRRVKENGVDTIHYDVMDGKYVKNKTFKNEYIDIIKSHGLKIHVHLMVKNLKKYIKLFIKSEVNIISFHIERCKSERQIEKYINLIKSNNIQCGLAIKPATTLNYFKDYISKVDHILILSVEPGAGGQHFLHEVDYKIKQLSKYCQVNKLTTQIDLDGGVNDKIILLYNNYVNNFISGTYFMNLTNKHQTIFMNRLKSNLLLGSNSLFSLK